jgi:hypothetical protein
MSNSIQRILKPVSTVLQKHITRRVTDNLFDAKVILGASIALDTCQNIMDFVEIGKNKKLNENQKKYFQAAKLTSAPVSAVLQIVSGSLIINRKTQDFLIKIAQKFLGLSQNLSESGRNNFRILSVLIGCVILAKRIVAPLIVTPLIAMTRDYLNKDIKNKERPYVKRFCYICYL